MGNEASQEGEGGGEVSRGGESAPGQPQRSAPPLLTQQSMPLPGPSQGLPSQEEQQQPPPQGVRRGSVGLLTMRRASSAGGPVAPPPVARRASVVEVPTELDLSNLSEEEKSVILSVMARAQSMEEEPPPTAIPKEVEAEVIPRHPEVEKCSLCRASPKEGSCVECGALCCRKCSRPIPSGKKHVWMCVRCVDRYPQLQHTIKQEGGATTNGEAPPPLDKRRRASEATPYSPQNHQEPPPQPRGRSDSLPSDKQRPHPQQRPQQKNDLPPQRPQDYQGPRPQGTPSPRPQQVRPRHPSDPQQPFPRPPNGQVRPSRRPQDQRMPHPNEHPRPPHPPPNGQMRPIQQQQNFDPPRQEPPAHHPADTKNNNMDQPSPQQRRKQTTEEQRALDNHREPSPNLENRNHNQNHPDQQRALHIHDPRLQNQPEQPRSHQQPMEQQQSRHPHPNGHIRQKHPAEQLQGDLKGFDQPTLHQPITEPQRADEHYANNVQMAPPKSQYQEEYKNPQYLSEKDFQKPVCHPTDPMTPRPQHPPTQLNPNLPPEGIVQNYAQKPPTVESPIKLQDVPHVTPPLRNQRLRQPPEQQMVLRPQHPAQDPIHNVQNKPVHDQEKFQAQREFSPERNRDKNQLNLYQQVQAQAKHIQQYSSEQIRHPYPEGQRPYPEDFKEEGQVEGGHPRQPNHISENLPLDRNVISDVIQRQQPPRNKPSPFQNVQSDDDKNGLYVSLSEPITLEHANHEAQRLFQQQQPAPPATLPRTKAPEVPQPAGRTRRGDKVVPGGNQNVPRTEVVPGGNQNVPRTGGTNPFRTETNPFRRESLPADMLDAGEYVTVAPQRRGSLDDRVKLSSANDPNRMADLVKPADSSPRTRDRRLEGQDFFDQPHKEDATHNRHLDEEERRNAINSGVYSNGSRRQLPTLDAQQHKKQQPTVPQPTPVPKARNSLPETSSGYVESRNSIPRTVPLTSITLQQQIDPIRSEDSHLEQNDINDLSQTRNKSYGASLQDQQRITDDLVHPNIIDNSGMFRNEEKKPPATLPRKKNEPNRNQANAEQRASQPAWSEVDQRKGKPMHPSDNQADLEQWASQPAYCEVDQRKGKPMHPSDNQADLEQRASQPAWSEVDPRKSKPIHPSDNQQDVAGYQDEEEEEDIDDYFQMIENAITDRKPQVIAGGRKTSEIQRQLFNKEIDRDHSSKSGVADYPSQKGQVSDALRQMDAYQKTPIQPIRVTSSSKAYPNAYVQRSTSQRVKEKNDLNMYEQDKVISSKKTYYDVEGDRVREESQYIIQPTDQPSEQLAAPEEGGKTKREYAKGYDKLLLHELTPDNRQPSAKHYLEEHKTQPVSYEAFSTAKAMQQMQTDPQPYATQPQRPFNQQVKEAENRTQSSDRPHYYTPQQAAETDFSGNGDKGKTSAIELQKKAKAAKSDPQDWSPVSDLSPILDVSPSVEAAEQELMEKFQEKDMNADVMNDVDDDSSLLKAGGIPRAKSGTISGMLEEFTRAMGLPGTSPLDDSGVRSAVSPTSLAISPISNAGSAMSTAHKDYQEGGFGSQVHKSGSSPQKTPQPTTPRRSHRRLPQPTVEQMQAAVAMAAQGPRDRAQQVQVASTTTGAAIFGVSDIPLDATWKVAEMTQQSFEQAYNKQQHPPNSTPTQDLHAGAVPPSPAPRAHSKSGSRTDDVMSQAVTSAAVQEGMCVVTPPARRSRSASCGVRGEDFGGGRLNGGSSTSPLSNNVFADIIATTVGSPQTPSTPRDKAGDSSDTQSEAESIKSVRLRRKLPNLPEENQLSPSPTRKTMDRNRNDFELQEASENRQTPVPTPVSAVTVTTTVTTSLETSRQPSPQLSGGLGTPSPQPIAGSLSPLLGRRGEMTRTPSPGGEAGTKLPQYMQNLKQQLRDELKAVTEERKIMLEKRSRDTSPHHPETEETPHHQETNTRDLNKTITSTPQTASPHHATQSKVAQAQQILLQANLFPPQTPSKHPNPAIGETKSPQKPPATPDAQYQTQVVSPYKTHTPLRESNEFLYQTVPHCPPPHTPQSYALQQEQLLYQALQESGGGGGRRTPQPEHQQYAPAARTPLPDAVPQYATTTHHRNNDDITIMTTATTTVVSASEGKRHHRHPPTTTVAPSAAIQSSGMESLRRLQTKMMTPQTTSSPKKGRRRHTSEIHFPTAQQQHEIMVAHTMNHPARQQQQQTPTTPQQFVQYYAQLQAQTADYRSMEFKPVDSHVRATDLLRSSGGRYGGSLGSVGLTGSTETLYQGGSSRRGLLNNRLQDYITDNRIMEQQQRLVGPDAYFQTLNNEINRLRRSSESLHRDATIYDKPVWGGQALQTQPQETRTSPQTTERRKRKEKKSRKPRSWHPSPYVSEDEEDQLTREEKKAKIKAEIARRRQQIEENMRLHEELCKLVERREAAPATSGRMQYVTSPTGSTYMTRQQVVESSHHQQQQQQQPVDSGDDTSSVLKAIDEILRKDLYSGPLSRSAWATYANPHQEQQIYHQQQQQQGYMTMPARGSRYEYTTGPAEMRNSASWYEEEQAPPHHVQVQYFQQQQQENNNPVTSSSADPESAMDESIARIASTFPTDEPPDILLSATPCGQPFSPGEITPAMPLLPDMPTRSRKLLENLGSSPILQNSGSAQSLYQDEEEECEAEEGGLGHRMQESSSLLKQRKAARAPASKTIQKYEFPVKRILLTRDPKDRSVSGNGLGMKVVGGKEVPGSNGMIGAYVAKIFPGGVVETLGEVKEGDQVLEWNGIPLTGRTYEEVQRIIASSADEVEIVIRCDLNMLETLSRQRSRGSPGMGHTSSGGQSRGEGQGRGGPSPAHSPYSPRGQSPALSSKRGGGNSMGNNIGQHRGSCQSLEGERRGGGGFQACDDTCQAQDQGGFCVRGSVSLAPTSRSVFAPTQGGNWPDIYETAIYSSPQSPDDFLDDNFQTHWPTGRNIEEMHFEVCCGPRTAIVYVPIVPVRPLVKSALLDRTAPYRQPHTRSLEDSLDDDYEPLLKSGDWDSTTTGGDAKTSTALGFYDLLRPRNSLGKVSLYLNGIKEKAEQYDWMKKNGLCRVTDTQSRPRAPSDLPGLKPVFVNDWKGHKKVKHEENDDNNNNTGAAGIQQVEKPTHPHRPPCVGSSPEATPYNILPKGCRGSFCIIL